MTCPPCNQNCNEGRNCPARSESQEPVAKIIAVGQYEFPALEWLSADHSFRAPIGSLLYPYPPQRTWVDLTSKDLNEIFELAMTGEGAVHRAIAKFKDRNK